MIRTSSGIAVLALSWLFALPLFYPVNNLAWIATTALGVFLLSGSSGFGASRNSDRSEPARRKMARRETALTVLLLLVAAWLAPRPYGLAPLLIALGLVAIELPIPRRWPTMLGQGAVVAGTVLIAQAMALAAYTWQTARCHDLPWPLTWLLTAVARLLQVDATTDGSTVVLHTMRKTHHLAATWELFFDPATLAFAVGMLVWCAMVARRQLGPGRRWSAWIANIRTLGLILLVWLPVRAGLLMAIYVHRVLRTPPEVPLHAMNQFFSPWVLGLLLAVPVVLAWRFVRTANGQRAASPEPMPSDWSWTSRPWHLPAAVSLLVLAAALLAVALHYEPVGRRQAGRVVVVERHSAWEPTTRPYDTQWFGHDSGYNYAAVFDYLSQYYEMERLLEGDAIDDDTLDLCDVLVIKTPTARYRKNEVEAVLRFVERGGGVLLIGDHTNFENCGTYMNDITRHLGFTFRHDLLFGFEQWPYDQRYVPPAVAHPAVQHLPPTDLAVSCSIDPGNSRGRPVVQATGLWSMPSDYHMDNYHPVPQHLPEMRAGAFVQAWAVRYGEGRVLAFTDSTIFSNFCTFQPGKAELLLGMVEWLNHRGGINLRWGLGVLGLMLLVAGFWLAPRRGRLGLLWLAALLCGWAVGSVATASVHRWAMPGPKVVRPLGRVVIDREVSRVPLSKGAFPVDADGQGYGLLETSIPRLGNYTVRCTGDDVFSGDMLVVICPTGSVDEQYRQRLQRYVADGGMLLVIDSPENKSSTANSLLWPFGLSMPFDQPWQGTLTLTDDWPKLRITQAWEVVGGTPVARLGPRPVAAMTQYHKGTAMAVGFGSVLNDARLGGSWTVEPSGEVQQRYQVLFALLRELITGERPRAPQ